MTKGSYYVVERIQTQLTYLAKLNVSRENVHCVNIENTDFTVIDVFLNHFYVVVKFSYFSLYYDG